MTGDFESLHSESVILQRVPRTTYRAPSRAATAVEDEVTFCSIQVSASPIDKVEPQTDKRLTPVSVRAGQQSEKDIQG
jgi:hypothetical protein